MKRLRHSMKKLNLESLEPRQLLAASVVINEFLAKNDGGLRDGNGRTSDWIEVYNTTEEAIDLTGYRLTDDPAAPAKWTFPATSIGAGEYLVVFASGQDEAPFVDPSGALHTNFTLKRGGEYLALSDPQGAILSEFGTSATVYPEQLSNISYGAPQSFSLIESSSPSTYHVADSGVPASWTSPTFDSLASGFSEGTSAIGFEARPDDRTNFVGLFDTELSELAHAAYVRMEFELKDASAISNLLLRLNYDDGFIAYLNGTQVAQENAPEVVGWFATATGRARRDSDVLEPSEIDLSEHRDALVDGQNVLAFHLMNHISDDSDMLLIAELDAAASNLSAVTDQELSFGYITTPTPGAANASNHEVFAGFVADTKFSVNRGFYNEPFQVEISTESEGAEIRYTTNGSAPTTENGAVYSGPITISTTTALRAAAFKEGYLPTNVDTQTYIFVNDVSSQGNAPEGYPAEWGLGSGPARPADYEMDPEITENPAYRDLMDDALLQVPTVSIVTDADFLFDPDTGIYQNTMQSGIDWERPASIELIYPDGTVGFQEDAGLRIQGGASRQPEKSPKHSFRLLFKGEYGATKLRHPWFTEETAVDEFDTIILRAGFNQSYIHHNTFLGDNRGRAQYVRDQWGKDMQRAMGYPAPHNTYAHLYINGMYWGLYNPTERPTDGFAASYFGGEKDEYDVYNSGELLDGTKDAWDKLWDELADDMTDDAQYQEVADLLDIPAYIDYMLLNHYGANADWDDHNWYSTRRRTDDGKWQFYMWDSEFLFIGQNDNAIKTSDGAKFPAYLLLGPRNNTGLKDNEEFRMLYADHIQRHFFNDGLLTPDSVVAMWEAKASQITDAIIGESARWGDYRRDVDNSGQPLVLLERDVQYAAERERLLNEYFPERTEIVVQQYRDVRFNNDDDWGLFPSIDAPRLSQHGGVITTNFEISLSADQGVVYYTTDGSDPRLKGGAVSPDALTYEGSFNLVVDATVRARALHEGEWSALTDADFVIGSDFPLRISEINYNPHAANSTPGANEAEGNNDRFEFIELVNVGNEAIDLEGVELIRSDVRGDSQGITFSFGSQPLAAGEHIVVVKDQEAFESRYGTSVRLADENGHGEAVFESEYGGQLSNDGEQLTLADATGQLIQQFSYGTRGDWPSRAGGAGSSLEVIDPTGGASNPVNWRASTDFGGSPGRAGAAASRVVISEILANTVAPNADRVELFNNGAQSVNVKNWYITDSADDYFKSKVSADKTIAPLGYQVLEQSEFGLDLDGINGSELFLISADTNGKPLQFVDRVGFGIAAPGVSVGPWPSLQDSFIALDTSTFGSPNSGPAVGDVIISELYFSPLDPDGDGPLRVRDFEFMEVTNTTDAPVNLAGWQLGGEVQFEFEEGTTIGAHESLVLVNFDPTSSTGVNKANVFKFTLGMDLTDTILGRIQDPNSRRSSDVLKDDGTLVQLLRSIDAPAGAPDFVPLVVVDQVDYLAESPWPADTNGVGNSLTRVRPEAYGPLATSWVAAPASPGTAEFFARLPGDSNDDGRFDQLDITAVLQAGKYGTNQPASWSEGDWNGDGVFDQLDIVEALQSDSYLKDPLAAVDRAFE